MEWKRSSVERKESKEELRKESVLSEKTAKPGKDVEGKPGGESWKLRRTCFS
jgi:hypothetical protein